MGRSAAGILSAEREKDGTGGHSHGSVLGYYNYCKDKFIFLSFYISISVYIVIVVYLGSGTSFFSWAGYWTDNGAYYYYNTVPNATYEETLILLKEYFDTEDIPIKYVDLDSWWYYKGIYDKYSSHK